MRARPAGAANARATPTSPAMRKIGMTEVGSDLA